MKQVDFSMSIFGIAGKTRIPILGIIKSFIYIKASLTLACLIAFFVRTGMIHILGDYFGSPSIIFGG